MLTFLVSYLVWILGLIGAGMLFVRLSRFGQTRPLALMVKDEQTEEPREY